MTKPWEGKHFKDLMEQYWPFYSDDNGLDDIKVIEALKKDWEEQEKEYPKMIVQEEESR